MIPPNPNQQIPPHSLEAERSVLGAIVLDASVFDLAAPLFGDGDGAFFAPAHREIWAAMSELRRRRVALDWRTIADQLKSAGVLARLEGGENYLVDLAGEVPTTQNAIHYARIVAEKARLRRLVEAGRSLMVQAFAAQRDSAELASEARASIAAVDSGGGAGPVMVGDVLGEVLDTIERRQLAPDDYVIPTGLVELDRIVIGFRPGEVAIIAARPGRGKTALLGNIAVRAALRGIPSLLFTLEMGKQEMIERFLAYQGRVNGEIIAGVGGKIPDPDWKRIQRAAVELAHVPLWIDDRMLSVGQITATCHSWHAQHVPQGEVGKRPLCLLGLDYVGLIRSSAKHERREAEVSSYSREWKGVVKDLHACGILVSQLNRRCEEQGRDPELSDLRETGSLEQDAHKVLFPHKGPVLDDQRNPTGQLEDYIIVAKNRGGRTGRARVRFLGELMSFENAAESWEVEQ